MKKLFCISLLCISAQLSSTLLDDCIKAIEEKDKEFFEKNSEAIKKEIADDRMSWCPSWKFFAECLYAAAKFNNNNVLEFLLNEKTSSTLYGVYYQAFSYAVRYCSDDVIKIFLSKSYNPYMRSEDNSPFDIAIRGNKLEYVKWFIESDKKNKYGRPPLFDPWTDTEYEPTPLFFAQKLKRTEIVQYLIEQGESVKIKKQEEDN